MSAVSQGFRDFSDIAIVTDLDEACSPCGSCRQFIVEFGLDIRVHLISGQSGAVTTMSIADLLPRAFTPKTLNDYSATLSDTDAAAAAAAAAPPPVQAVPEVARQGAPPS